MDMFTWERQADKLTPPDRSCREKRRRRITDAGCSINARQKKLWVK
jgi:hypothetical protein